MQSHNFGIGFQTCYIPGVCSEELPQCLFSTDDDCHLNRLQYHKRGLISGLQMAQLAQMLAVTQTREIKIGQYCSGSREDTTYHTAKLPTVISVGRQRHSLRFAELPSGLQSLRHDRTSPCRPWPYARCGIYRSWLMLHASHCQYQQGLQPH